MQNSLLLVIRDGASIWLLQLTCPKWSDKRKTPTSIDSRLPVFFCFCHNSLYVRYNPLTLFLILSLSFCPVYWQLLREEDLISKHSEQQQQKRVLIFSKWFWDFQIIWLCHSNGVLYFPNDFWDFQISGCVTTIEFYIFQTILGFSDNLVVSQQWRRRTSFWSPHLVTLVCNCQTKRLSIFFWNLEI